MDAFLANITRFIPAPAGNAPQRLSPCFPAPVHPRACGERRATDGDFRGSGGSSPRLRGTPPQPLDGARRLRFIPAPAGNAWLSARRRAAHAVHPRACGERLFRRDLNGRHNGSSPRLRGTRQLDIGSLERGRFIPAPAGNARASAIAADTCAVHPRACGERPSAAPICMMIGGSSPRLRGTQELPIKALKGMRFIPAPAGNARPPRSSACRTSVHPRACGERPPAAADSASASGSSPRLRGTLLGIQAHTSKSRFIPAPAGNAGPRIRI